MIKSIKFLDSPHLNSVKWAAKAFPQVQIAALITLLGIYRHQSIRIDDGREFPTVAPI